MNSSFQQGILPSPSLDRLESVQILRGVAAMLVVFNHAGLFLALERNFNLGPSFLAPSEAVVKMGAIGVDLFFVISGFVMALSARRFVGGPSGAGVFLTHRFIRIAPLFYLGCLLMLAEALRARIAIDPVSVLNSLTFIPIFDDASYSWPLHYLGWTLAFEWTFYLLVALLIAVGRGGQPLLLLALVGVVPLAGLMLQPQLMTGRVLTNPILWEFALGIFACHLHDKGWIDRVRWPVALLAAASLVTGVHALWVRPDEVMALGEDTIMGDMSAARALFWGVPAFVFFVAFIGFWRGSDGFFGRVLKRLGDASYSIYLSHLFVVIFMRQVLKFVTIDPDLVVVATLVLSAGVGMGVYRLVEKPLLTLGQQRIRRWSVQHVRPVVEPPPL